MTEDNKIINALWIGKTLSLIELLTLYSFTHHGHIIHLWTYCEIETPVPEGVVLKDANLIIPENEIIIRKHSDPATGVGKGSVGAPFSDLFRYKLLYEFGGWWVDMDVTCLKPLNIDEPYFFRSHLILDIIGNVIKCPKGSELMRRTYLEVKKTCDENTLDWLLPNKILNKNVHELGLIKYRLKDISNLDNWNETIKYIRSNKQLPSTWYVIHWSNEEWRINRLNKNNIRLRNSAFGKLIWQYEVPVGDVNYWDQILNEIILARPLQAFRRFKEFNTRMFWYYYRHLKSYILKFFNAGQKEVDSDATL